MALIFGPKDSIGITQSHHLDAGSYRVSARISGIGSVAGTVTLNRASTGAVLQTFSLSGDGGDAQAQTITLSAGIYYFNAAAISGTSASLFMVTTEESESDEWNGLGPVPFGSGDASIIFEHGLRTEITSSDVSGLWDSAVIQGAGSGAIVYDPVLGTQFNGAGYRFQLSEAAIAALDQGGQISIEVQSQWATYNNARTSTGYVPSPSTEYLLGGFSSDSVVQQLLRKSSSSEVVATSVGGGGATFEHINFTVGADNGFPRLNSAHKDGFIRFTVAWEGDLSAGAGRRIWMCVDGYPIVTGTTASTVTDMLNDFYLGSDRGIAGSFMDTHFCRNLTIASAIPVWVPLGKSLYVLSDSLWDNVPYDEATGLQDNITKYALQSTIVKATGQHLDSITVSENGGEGVGGYLGVNQIDEAAANAAGAGGVTDLMLNLGTNDMISVSYSDATFRSDYAALLASVAPNFDRVFINLPPPYFPADADAAIKGRFEQVRLAIFESIAAFDAANPLQAGKVRIGVDSFELLGADHTLANQAVFPSHTVDGTHWADSWNFLVGEKAASLFI